MDVSKILNGLNEEQKKAVLHKDGPSLVIAAAGSGKTKTIISRAQYLIANGVNPYNMVLFTFTNKAAREIRDRISLAVGEDLASKITVGTYHSVCCRILRQYAEELGYTKKFTILDSDDSKTIIKDIIKDVDIELFSMISYISLKKRNKISPVKAIQDQKDKLAPYYLKYQTRIKKENSMDFDDLILNTVKLLETRPIVYDKIINRYKYIIADEFQDSSKLDIQLITLLGGETENIYMVGDDYQAIYHFRGSDVTNILNLKKRFNNLKIYNLSQNYRSTKNIINAANCIIKNNVKQYDKHVFTENDEGSPVIFMEEDNSYKESLKIANTIQLLINKYNNSYKDIAILYRTSAQSAAIEEQLLKAKIPYRIIGGLNFYKREEIKDILSYLYFAINPCFAEAFKRIINIPRRGVGDASLEKIFNYSLDNNVDLLEASENIELKGKAKKGVASFVSIIKEIQNNLTEMNIPEIIECIIEKIDYHEHLKKKYKGDDLFDKTENLNELINISYSFLTLEEFLENSSLDSIIIDKQDDDKVNLMTIHASKGLEFKSIIISGVSEGFCPHYKSLKNIVQLEEERRLFYVALTRAKELAFLTRAKKMFNRGMTFDTKMSRFVKEIDENYIFNA